MAEMVPGAGKETGAREARRAHLVWMLRVPPGPMGCRCRAAAGTGKWSTLSSKKTKTFEPSQQFSLFNCGGNRYDENLELNQKC